MRFPLVYFQVWHYKYAMIHESVVSPSGRQERTLPMSSRLPIHHREYRYPPSKNPYWNKIHQIQDWVFSDNETESLQGQWSSRFQGVLKDDVPREIHVEVGCNAGHVIVEWAAQNPGKTFIGIDWKFKPIFRGAEKAIHRNLKNLFFLRAHAERIQYIFGNQELDGLNIFFPDPWPRKSQWKYRYINTERLREIAPLMKPNAIFHIKTDHPGYFEWILEAVAQVQDLWEIVDLNRDLHRDHPNPRSLRIPEVTLFESLFIKDQIPIQSLKLRVKR